MTQPYLFPLEVLPTGFQFPRSFTNFVSGGEIPYLEPWWFICEDAKLADGWLKIVKDWYPKRPLVPFAKYEGTDDIACFDGSAVSNDPIVHYVHTFAESPYEARGWVPNFDAWLARAQEESRIYKSEGDQD